MTDGSERRRYHRTPVSLKVRLKTEDGTQLVNTRDISDGGIYLLMDEEELPPVGTKVKVQAQGMAVEAPVVEMEVVRTCSDGIGLRFAGDVPEGDQSTN